MRLFLLHKLDVLSFFYKLRSCPWKMANDKNVLFLASFPCDISHQLWLWPEISQGNRGLR